MALLEFETLTVAALETVIRVENSLTYNTYFSSKAHRLHASNVFLLPNADKFGLLPIFLRSFRAISLSLLQ